MTKAERIYHHYRVGHREGGSLIAPQPEPDAGEEWRVYKTKPERKTSDVELYGCGEPLRLPWHREGFLEQVAADHTRAALVPKLIEALKGVAIMLNTELERYESEPWAQRVRAALALVKGRE